MLARAERIGVLVAAGEDRYDVPSPSLLSVAEQVAARGVSLDGALAVFEQVEQHCDAVSGAFVARSRGRASPREARAFRSGSTGCRSIIRST